MGEGTSRHTKIGREKGIKNSTQIIFLYILGMKFTIIQRPSYSALQCTMKQGEKIRAESGSMLAMDATARIEGKVEGGLWKAIKRTVLTNESFFVTTISAVQDETEVYLAPRSTGDVEEIKLNDTAFIVQGGAFLASEAGVETDSQFTGWKGFVSGEGIFMIKASGKGSMFVSSFGGIFTKELKAGEQFLVDNGHVVAFPADMTYDIAQTGSGVVDMVTTGEGLVVKFTGPGLIYIQTRNLRSFAEELNPFLRDRQKSQGAGMLGQVFGG